MNSRPLNIAQVVASSGAGGLEKHVGELCEELAKAGHGVTVIAPQEFTRQLPHGIEGRAVRLDRGRHDPRSLLALTRTLRGLDCDIVHAHATKAAFMTGLIRPLLRCPTVATLHNVKHSLSAYRMHDHVIAVSRTLAREFSPGQVSVIYHGIRAREIVPMDLRTLFNLPPERPVLLAVGRLVPAKGFDVLIEAVSGLPVSLLIAGDGPTQPYLAAAAEKCGESTAIRFLGYRNDIPSLMAHSDAVVISSRREGFSYVFAEAALLKRPVLSTDVPVPNEVLPSDLIVRTGSAVALRQRLQQLLEDISHWNEIMEPVYRFAEQQLNLNAMTEKTLATYRKIIGH
ncbi:glycosyltransferase [Thioalkalivibrio thiocyanodenitrificans]|uniref:glycosyltransferase n=1 Tax=Thioalkalivibrio thiocyanodenitrificans TaxID=243063 RepID=UPI0018DC978F|nr:glycosyltransferase [Thioalkalivibrio thiocyanodenitrificans]